MQLDGVARLDDVDGVADRREVGLRHPDGIRVRIVEIQARPEFAPLEFPFDDLEFQLQVFASSGLVRLHIRIDDDSLVFPGRDCFEPDAGFDFVGVEIDGSHDVFSPELRQRGQRLTVVDYGFVRGVVLLGDGRS